MASKEFEIDSVYIVPLSSVSEDTVSQLDSSRSRKLQIHVHPVNTPVASHDRGPRLYVQKMQIPESQPSGFRITVPEDIPANIPDDLSGVLAEAQAKDCHFVILDNTYEGPGHIEQCVTVSRTHIHPDTIEELGSPGNGRTGLQAYRLETPGEHRRTFQVTVPDHIPAYVAGNGACNLKAILEKAASLGCKYVILSPWGRIMSWSQIF